MHGRRVGRGESSYPLPAIELIDLIRIKAQLLFHGVDNSPLPTTDKIRQLHLDLHFLNISIKVDEILFFLGLHWRQGQIDNLLDLPCTVSHVPIEINADLKPGLLPLEQFLFFRIFFVKIFCGHLQDHFT